MWKARIHIVKTGMLTQLLDDGRKGIQDMGVPLSGCMDRSSAHIANLLVGNDANSPLFEITMQGPVMRFEGDCYIAITGADISPKVDGTPIESYQTVYVKSGSELSFDKLTSGCRTYLAIAGQLKLNRWMSSVNLIQAINIPALLSNNITKDTFLDLENVKMITKKRWTGHKFEKQEVYKIRILEGPEYALLDEQHQKELLQNTFSVSNDSNRMAYRLKETLSEYKSNHELISSGIVLGTIQVSNAGQPIILLNDAGTTGGYPRIANVISTDLSILAQLKYRDKIKFEMLSLAQAQDILKEHRNSFKSLS